MFTFQLLNYFVTDHFSYQKCCAAQGVHENLVINVDVVTGKHQLTSQLRLSPCVRMFPASI